MKKSTLITTIAMIVVVVVALSTATYAWFTSSAISTATVSMSTLASSDLSLTVVNDLSQAKSWTNGQTGIGIALSGNVGLWSPEATLTNSVTYSESDLAMSKANFYEAYYASATTATQKSPSTGRGMDAIRVTNISGDSKHCYLYVVIAVNGDAANTNNLYAAQATSFYVTIDDGENAVRKITNGYGYGTAAAETYIEAEEFVADTQYYSKGSNDSYSTETIADASAFAAFEGILYTKVEGFGTGANITKHNTGATATGLIAQANFQGDTATLTARPAYNGLTTGGFLEASRDNSALGVTEGQYVLAYCIDLGTVANNASLVLGVYNWIDGWYANNSAGNANFSITYAFETSGTQTL